MITSRPLAAVSPEGTASPSSPATVTTAALTRWQQRCEAVRAYCLPAQHHLLDAVQTCGQAALQSTPLPHLLDVQGMSAVTIERILDLTQAFDALLTATSANIPLLDGTNCVVLFAEPSTRTHASFAMSAQMLGANLIVLDSTASSLNKGETILDTALTINAMNPQLLVIRHRCAGMAALLASKVLCGVLNAGDGGHAHPTQALIDSLVIRQRKGTLHGKVVAICGDIAHSRVARSNLHALRSLGASVRFVAPPTLLPQGEATAACFIDMDEGLRDADVVMMLRLQSERTNDASLPSRREFFQYYGLTRARLAKAKPDAIVMHPGPMNRGVEIDSDVADDPAVSVIREQVRWGVPLRMACLALVAMHHTPNVLPLNAGR